MSFGPVPGVDGRAATVSGDGDDVLTLGRRSGGGAGRDRLGTGRGASSAAPGGPREVRRRRPLPAGRAVVGGFLVALAAVGIFVAYTRATTEHRVQFAVATRDMAVGHRIGPGDVSSAPMDLPSTIATTDAFRDPRELLGAVVVGPVRSGELIQVSDVVAGQAASVSRQLSFSLPLSRAVDGTLRPGDTVDVIATFGTGTGATTSAVAQGLSIVSLSGESATFESGNDATEVVTVSVPDGGELLPLVQAVNAGQVVLVRSTGAQPLHTGGAYAGPAATGTGGSGL